MVHIRIAIILSSDLPPAIPVFHKMSSKIKAQLDQNAVPKRYERLYDIHGSVGLKAIFIKESLKKIKYHKQNFGPFTNGHQITFKGVEVPNLVKEIDSLIFELSSMLDFFSRELDLILDPWFGKDSAIWKIYKKCIKECSHDPLAKRLIDVVQSDWYPYFRKMRNRITHRLPITISTYGSEAYFPDNPSSDDLFPGTSKRFSLIGTCERWVNDVLDYINDSTKEIGRRVFSDW